MSNSKKPATYEHVTPALIQSVEFVLGEAAKHRYSTSGVYHAHNQVFKKNETPEACASCLKNRADALKKWYLDYAADLATQGKDVYGKKLKEVAPEVPAPIVPRETFSDLQSMYAHYNPVIVVTHDKGEPQPEDEVKGINMILEQHGAEGDNTLFPEEVELLNARLDELAKPLTNVDTTNADGSFIVKDKDGNVHEVTFNEGEEGANTLTYVNEAGEVKNMKPGTYSLDNGDAYAVQPGGKATFKAGEESIL